MASQRDAFKYWAFISYSSRDRTWGRWLIRQLERYRIPRALVGRATSKGPVPRRLYPIFRDRDELRAGGEVGEALRAALMASRSLIVICSPSSANPASWVGREIELFSAAGRQDDILALIVDGTPHASRSPDGPDRECFPRALRYRWDADGRITGEPADPLAADVRREDPRPRASRRKALLKLIAPMIDVDFDELEQRDRRRRRQQMLAWTAASIAVAAALGISSAAALQQGRQTLSRSLAHDATQSVAETDLALLLAVESYQMAPSPEAHASLLRAVRSNPRLVTYLHRAERIHDVAIDPAGAIVAVASCSGACPISDLQVYGLDTREMRAPPVRLPGEVRQLRIQGDGTMLVSWRGDDQHVVEALDVRAPGGPRALVYRTNQPVMMAGSRDGSLAAVSTSFETKIFNRRIPVMWCHLDPQGPPLAMAFSDDGEYFAIASQRDTTWTRLAERSGTSCAEHHVRMPASVSDVGFDAVGAHVYVAAQDGTVMRQPLASGRSPEVFTPFPSGTPGFQNWLGADARRLLSHFRTHLRVFPLDTRQELVDARRREAEEGGSFVAIDAIDRALENPDVADLLHVDAKRAAMSHDGRIVATADDRTVRIWDLSADPLVTVAADAVPAIAERREAVGAGGRFRVTADTATNGKCGSDFNDLCETWTTLRLIDARSGAIIDTLEGPKGSILDFGPLAVEFDDAHRVVVSREMSREIWTVAPEALRERACRMANRTLTGDEVRRHLPAWWQRALRRNPGCAAASR